MKISIKSNLLRHLFQSVYFINGTAYAGKSTMVKRLAQAHGGICCGENYHDILMDAINPEDQPNLSYFQTMSGWPEFLNRAPEAYARWIDGTGEEAAQLEILRLIQLAAPGRKIFVDTNINVETLRAISSPRRVAIMLAPQAASVDRFFERDDPEKRFLRDQIRLCANPEKTLKNFRACLARINSPERYAAFANSGFFTLVRDEARTPEETQSILEDHFGLNARAESIHTPRFDAHKDIDKQ